jgi:ABC-type polysaccharide/polyol phosphate transport system ATPase subunit
MPLVDISVVNVSKRYSIANSRADGTGSFLSKLFPRKVHRWALRGVSFEVFRGEALGIVGHNGAGKSTLVKLLSGITVPTKGEITISGTLSAMVEVGAGFNIELTGRENVFLAGSILGIGRREIARKMAEILEFAGIGDYIDAPVKTYSSGQFLRLGFSIAAQLDQDIFLLDEVLAVGDIAFQARCFDRLDRLRRSGKTIVLISHDLAAIECICDRAILLNQGEVVMTGSPRDIIEEYSRTAYAAMSRPGSSSVANLTRVHFEGPEEGQVRTGEPMSAHVAFQLKEPVQDPVVNISIYWPSGYLCTQLTSAGSRHHHPLHDGPVCFDFTCPVLPMQRGLYRVDVSIERESEVIGHWRCCSLLRVDPGKIILGDFCLEYSCKISAGGTREVLPRLQM